MRKGQFVVSLVWFGTLRSVRAQQLIRLTVSIKKQVINATLGIFSSKTFYINGQDGLFY